MEQLTGFGIPMLAVFIAGFLVWATTQVCKKAIREGKLKYLFISALASLLVSCLVVATMGMWNWLIYAWTSYGGWLAANMLQKLYARRVKGLIEKNA